MNHHPYHSPKLNTPLKVTGPSSVAPSFRSPNRSDTSVQHLPVEIRTHKVHGKCWPGRFQPTRLSTLPKKPLKIGRYPKQGKDRIPTIHFQVRTVSFREGIFWNILNTVSQLRDSKFILLAPSVTIGSSSAIFGHQSIRSGSSTLPSCKGNVFLGPTSNAIYSGERAKNGKLPPNRASTNINSLPHHHTHRYWQVSASASWNAPKMLLKMAKNLMQLWSFRPRILWTSWAYFSSKPEGGWTKKNIEENPDILKGQTRSWRIGYTYPLGLWDNTSTKQEEMM